MSQRDGDRDSKTDRLICEPWNGSRSPEFRKFERNIKCDLLGYFLPEDECSIWDAMIDMDQGGQANGALAMPGQNQNGHAQARPAQPSPAQPSPAQPGSDPVRSF